MNRTDPWQIWSSPWNKAGHTCGFNKVQTWALPGGCYSILNYHPTLSLTKLPLCEHTGLLEALQLVLLITGLMITVVRQCLTTTDLSPWVLHLSIATQLRLLGLPTAETKKGNSRPSRGTASRIGTRTEWEKIYSAMVYAGTSYLEYVKSFKN